MSQITTHLVDTSTGMPGSGVKVTLESLGAGGWTERSRNVTDGDGRVRGLLPDGERLTAGVYRVRFETGAYFRARNVESFFPHVEGTFSVSAAGGHHPGP